MKPLLRFLLLIVLIVAGSHKVEAAGYKDVSKEHFAYDAIMWASTNGMIDGYENGTFKPNATITEQQFAKLLANYFELEPTYDELKKQTVAANWSDEFYNRLASYGVPLNGYFNNTIRATAVKRGVVAQAITHLAEGKRGLNDSIQFLLDHYISTGQNPTYENRDLQKFFGTSNNMTRAQVVTLLYRLDSMKFYTISDDAEQINQNASNISIMIRAKNGQNQLDQTIQLITAEKSPWGGTYSYYYKWGKGAAEYNRRDAIISNTSSKSFDVSLTTNDGLDVGSVEGTATITSNKKAIMYKSSNGNRCVMEFDLLTNALKVTEVDCQAERGEGTNFSGTLKKQ